MIHLEISNGTPLLLIHDAKDEPQSYGIAPAGEAIELVRQDTGECYTLRRIAEGWSCTCRAYEFRARRNETQCKHGRALALLQRFSELMGGTNVRILAEGVERGVRSAVFDAIP